MKSTLIRFSLFFKKGSETKLTVLGQFDLVDRFVRKYNLKNLYFYSRYVHILRLYFFQTTSYSMHT